MSQEPADGGEPDDPLPEGTKHVKVSHKHITVRVSGEEDWLEAPSFDDVEIQRKGTPGGGERKTITFEKGDQFPLAVARDVYSAFGDHLLCMDGNHQALNSPYRGGGTGLDIPGGPAGGL